MSSTHKTVALFGATGHLGTAIAHALKSQNYRVRAFARASAKSEKLKTLVDEVIIFDFAKDEFHKGHLAHCDYVISALGKSVSLKDHGTATFEQVDFGYNVKILEEAIRSGLKKFVYVSALHAEQYPDLTYFKVHADFSKELKAAEMNQKIDYAIVQPTGLFSVYQEVLEMAQKGQLGIIGTGEARTNPVSDDDVARACVAALAGAEKVIPIGGPEALSRAEIAQMLAERAGIKRKLPHLPAWVLQSFLLPVLKVFNRNMYDKLAFLVQVSVDDCVAPPIGGMSLREYLWR
jgi:uncharacterized protein YbjT (DUF2867 family)